ncbi:MAG: XdhC family protein [Thermoflexales bacterium]|nr:XdhC family protein [Thermoflexales bacterium]MDW8352848.1 XdhC family protein [Anaerolineae bacterium]
MREIIRAIGEWSAQGEPVAVATVIEAWGSAPRGVGAKMAFTPSHRIVGSVSGGCVEGAVFTAGLDTLATGRPQLLRFGVADETAFETVGLACGGNIAVFVEPLTSALQAFWQRVFAHDLAAATATVVHGPEVWLGYKLMLDARGEVTSLAGAARAPEVDAALLAAARAALREGMSRQVELLTADGLQLTAFVEALLPPPTLVIVGGAHIAIALTTLAKTMGYRVIVVDPRSAFGNVARFPHADRIINLHPRQAFESLKMTRSTAVVALTHDAKLDDPALCIALTGPAFYVGALGGAKTREARRKRLAAAGLSEAQLNRLHSPIGLDIGARTPEEIALATMAQIVAAYNAMAREGLR